MLFRSGCSLVLINSEKGKLLFQSVLNQLNFFEVGIEDCMQPNLIKPSDIDFNRDNFETDYSKHGFEYVMKKYGDMGLRYKITKRGHKLKNAIIKIIKKIKIIK